MQNRYEHWKALAESLRLPHGMKLTRAEHARLNIDLARLSQMVFDESHPPAQIEIRPTLLAIDALAAELMYQVDRLPRDAWAHLVPFRSQESIVTELRNIGGVFRAAASLAEFEVEYDSARPRQGRYLQGRKIDARLRTFVVGLVALFEKYTGTIAEFARPVDDNNGSLVVQFTLAAYCHFLPP